jgi:Rps23 Pro-64 3,4-dihydroxylase Tpa1-like proline 4-hydroxylase
LDLKETRPSAFTNKDKLSKVTAEGQYDFDYALLLQQWKMITELPQSLSDSSQQPFGETGPQLQSYYSAVAGFQDQDS